VGGEGEGEGKVVEQQIGALGNPCSSFSSSSPLLCIRRGFDKNFTLGSAIKVYIFGCSKIDRPILQIYKSLKDIWVFKLIDRTF
jgi:hypothetical protein